MNCPYCGNDKTKVIATVNSPDRVSRRRECLKCRERFTTTEYSPASPSLTPDDLKTIVQTRNALFAACSALGAIIRS